jgi:hypothetical protein
MVDLATAARSLPDVVEGIACAGTKLESRTFATNAKTFLFVSAQEARLKLDASAAAAKRLGFEVGGNAGSSCRSTRSRRRRRCAAGSPRATA